MNRITRCFWPVWTLLLVAAAQAEDVAPGVTFEVFTLPDPNVVHVLAVDRDEEGYRLEVGWPQGVRNFAQREGTTRIAERYDFPPGHDVVGAVNASFFGAVPEINGATGSRGEMQEMPDGRRETLVATELGELFIVDGVEHVPGRVTFSDGTSMELRQYNRPGSPNVITAYTPSWGRVETGTAEVGGAPEGLTAVVVEGVEIHLAGRSGSGATQVARMSFGDEMSGTVSAVLLDAAARGVVVPAGGMVLLVGPELREVVRPRVSEGDVLRWRFDALPREMDRFDMAVTGVGWLVKGGEAHRENWKRHGFAKVRHPRTVIAWNDDRLFLVVFDGRSKESRGVNFEEMASFLIGELGACEAINLDGGGSSTMVVDGEIRNAPSDGWERLVANAVLLVREP